MTEREKVHIPFWLVAWKLFNYSRKYVRQVITSYRIQLHIQNEANPKKEKINAKRDAVLCVNDVSTANAGEWERERTHFIYFHAQNTPSNAFRLTFIYCFNKKQKLNCVHSINKAFCAVMCLGVCVRLYPVARMIYLRELNFKQNANAKRADTRKKGSPSRSRSENE